MVWNRFDAELRDTLEHARRKTRPPEAKPPGVPLAAGPPHAAPGAGVEFLPRHYRQPPDNTRLAPPVPPPETPSKCLWCGRRVCRYHRDLDPLLHEYHNLLGYKHG